MIYRLLQALMLLSLLLAIYGYWKFSRPDAPPLQAFINGNVLTMNAENDRAQAVLIEGESILAVGSTQEITARIQSHSARSKIIVNDLTGRTLIPGIVDAHSHFPGSGVYKFAADLNAPPIGDVLNIDQLMVKLRQQDLATESQSWLFGMGYDDTQLAEKRHPMREELDAISTSRPIFILHISGHMGVANSEAFRRLGINPDSVAPAGGEYQKNSAGLFTGLILETAVSPFLKSATDFTPTQIVEIAQAASREYAAQGITTLQNGAGEKRHVVGLHWVSKLDLVPQRIMVWPLYDAMDEAELNAMRAKNTAYYEVGAIKIVADGSIQGYTAYLTKPYYRPPTNVANQADAKRFVGKPVIERQKLEQLVKHFFAKGQQLAIHGNGDAAIDDIIYAVEQASKEFPQSDARTILVHAQMARKDQLKKMKALGITPSFFSAHTYYWGDRHREIFMGAKRASSMSPANSASKLGLPFSIHLDSPVVPMESMRLLWSAVNRKSFGDRTVGYKERLSRGQALRSITIDAAYQVFKENQIGSIEVGKLADLVVLDSDPTNSSVDLLDINIMATYVGGRQIYQASVR